MLSTNLTTNEVKDSTGAEVEFLRQSVSARSLVFAMSGESPSHPRRITVSHSEIGGGLKKRRRSVVRVDYTISGGIDSTVAVVHSAYIVMDIPIGNIGDYNEAKHALAYLLSLCATTGAASTVLFDCTGNGANALIQGTL